MVNLNLKEPVKIVEFNIKETKLSEKKKNWKYKSKIVI